MADAATNPRKGRKQGPRTPKPIFALVGYTDENGNAVALNKNGLSIKLVRDAAQIVDMLTSGETNGLTPVRVELPEPAKRTAPAAA